MLVLMVSFINLTSTNGHTNPDSYRKRERGREERGEEGRKGERKGGKEREYNLAVLNLIKKDLCQNCGIK